jgi:nucleoside-diphosphate-sugar epimerase
MTTITGAPEQGNYPHTFDWAAIKTSIDWQRNKDKLVVVLGVGYLGGNLCNVLLENGYKVRGVDNFYKGRHPLLFQLISHPNFEFAFGDVSNYQDVGRVLKGTDYIVFTAGLVGFPICSKYPDLAYKVNVDGAENIWRWKEEKTKLIYMSTGSIYGRIEDGKECDENSPANPTSIYGSTKKEAERIVLDGSNTIVHRYSTAFGLSYGLCRPDLLINNLVRDAVTAHKITLYSPHDQRSFVHTDDICSAILFTITNFDKMKYNIYNVGHPYLNLTKLEIAEYIKYKTKCKLEIINGENDPDNRNYHVNFDRILSEGWEPKVDFEKSIDQLIKIAPYM